MSEIKAIQSPPKRSANRVSLMNKQGGLRITLISLHGLIRGTSPELGRDADTGGQITYVLELTRELAKHPHVRSVELLTRQIVDPRVGSEYGVIEEEIAPKAKIVRIPFGPKRYLRKEALWPYIEHFVDQTLVHFRRAGIPDIIHGHYADAGLAGAQLARLLHVPFLFTGHSLGRVKKQQFLTAKSTADSLEHKFKFGVRTEAEEIALETASMVVTSTAQEVKEQYELYDHYVPSRMEVIPPGVDLSRFTPSTDPQLSDSQDKPSPIISDLERFLREPQKPIILTLARLDERKNLSRLVETYGKSEKLRSLANLVLVMGTRDDVSHMPRTQRKVLEQILLLIDRYDLYGSVAYPKTHSQEDVPKLYQHVAKGRGVFVNPALTEPFGLTLLEAGATGLPIIATNDGGPNDIIANCNNGLLIDPLDNESIERAILRALTEPAQWDTWSANGIQATRQHYSWQNHVTRYLRDLDDILAHEDVPTLVHRPRAKNLPEFSRLIVTDLDNTLTGDDQALQEFVEIVQSHDHIGFGIATGRSLLSATQLISELQLPNPDLIVSDAGTKLHYGPGLVPDGSWRNQIGYAWRPDEIRSLLRDVPGLHPQPNENQSEYKISYEIDSSLAPTTIELKKRIREAGLRAKVIVSLGMYLDIIPVRGGSEMSMRHLLWKWGFSPENVLVAGDSGNDVGMLLGRSLGVVVGNYSSELEWLRKRPRIFFANGRHARGIIEGIHYYQFLDNIVIPNDHIETDHSHAVVTADEALAN